MKQETAPKTIYDLFLMYPKIHVDELYHGPSKDTSSCRAKTIEAIYEDAEQFLRDYGHLFAGNVPSASMLSDFCYARYP